MDLAELSERTGLERRKLRYCLDHNLVPALRVNIVDDEVGRPRKFADDVGYAIVCAARLLDVGLPHDTIRHFLSGLLEIRLRGSKGAPKLAVVAVLEGSFAAHAELGDGINVRIVFGDYVSPWHAPGNPAKIANSYRPHVSVTLDLGLIRDEVFGKSTD